MVQALEFLSLRGESQMELLVLASAWPSPDAVDIEGGKQQVEHPSPAVLPLLSDSTFLQERKEGMESTKYLQGYILYTIYEYIRKYIKAW